MKMCLAIANNTTRVSRTTRALESSTGTHPALRGRVQLPQRSDKKDPQQQMDTLQPQQASCGKAPLRPLPHESVSRPTDACSNGAPSHERMGQTALLSVGAEAAEKSERPPASECINLTSTERRTGPDRSHFAAHGIDSAAIWSSGQVRMPNRDRE